jgi:hypothetical protein
MQPNRVQVKMMGNSLKNESPLVQNVYVRACVRRERE